MMRYCPAPSVTTVRTFSINAGLAASTVTPGSTAPDESLTTPAIDAWAYTALGISAETRKTPRIRTSTRISSTPFLRRGHPGGREKYDGGGSRPNVYASWTRGSRGRRGAPYKAWAGTCRPSSEFRFPSSELAYQSYCMLNLAKRAGMTTVGTR